MPASTPLSDRLWEKVDTTGGPDACWPWTGCLDPDGYGRVNADGRSALAHRVAWSLVNATPIPGTLDHRCHDPLVCAGGPTCPHRSCCNPAHLVASTRGGNARRGNHAKQPHTHCGNGHEFTPANTYVHPPSGHRACRRCAANRASGRPKGA